MKLCFGEKFIELLQSYLKSLSKEELSNLWRYENWAEDELSKIDKDELRKSFEDQLLFGKSKIKITDTGIKRVHPYEEDSTEEE